MNKSDNRSNDGKLTVQSFAASNFQPVITYRAKACSRQESVRGRKYKEHELVSSSPYTFVVAFIFETLKDRERPTGGEWNQLEHTEHFSKPFNIPLSVSMLSYE